jgi:hypothetical protein
MLDGDWSSDVCSSDLPKFGKALTCLALKEKDLQFIDKDMEKTLMFDVDQPFNLPREWKADFFNPAENTRRYKH